ncbi:unnamed protein product [Leptidea sinapis]|uniref:Uncharacterized protein n=1 Tax=Leptidea sinapis TaxID=189913 RepID=A0A5E4Q7Q1_9NEOP|nr:unnamed protein product [Leptidea sinapis]
MQCQKFLVLITVLIIVEPIAALRADIVKEWARTLGDEIWRLSESLTKSDHIRICKEKRWKTNSGIVPEVC